MQNNQESLVGGVIGKEYLAFTLGDEEYGIEILAVQEIRSYETVTKIANSPEFIKGVINLRGEIVPVIDMRIKFNLDKVLYNEFTVVIVLNVGGQVVGMVVDGVSDVIARLKTAIATVQISFRPSTLSFRSLTMTFARVKTAIAAL